MSTGKIILVILVFVLFLGKLCVASTCLDHKIFHRDDELFYDAAGFANCLYENQCGLGLKALEKVRKKDQVLYSYLKGVALAKGDCFKQNVKDAETLLFYAAQYDTNFMLSFLKFCISFDIWKHEYFEIALKSSDFGFLEALWYCAGYLYNTGDKPLNIAHFYMFTKIFHNIVKHKLKIYNTKNKTKYEYLISLNNGFMPILKDARIELLRYKDELFISEVDNKINNISNHMIKNHVILTGAREKLTRLYSPISGAVTDGKQYKQPKPKKKTQTPKVTLTLPEIIELFEDIKR